MAHLEKLFSEGPPDRPYHTLDRVVYKTETATAEMKEIKPVKKDYHPITTEIHVTELRPIKLDPMPKRATSESQFNNDSLDKKKQMWERRLQSESSMADKKAHTVDRSYAANYQNSYSENRSEEKSNMIKTVTSRTGSHSSSSSTTSPNGTISPNEFRRRDVSPDFKLIEKKVTTVDGKCQCCPYGYHVDVDFMDYCDTMSNQSYLKQLKRIEKEKRKLRKSMEVYLQEQKQEHVTEYTMNPMQTQTYYKEATTNKLLDEIDTSVDQTLSSIETMMTNSSQKYTDSGTATMNRTEKKFNTFPKKLGREVAQELQTYNETFTATFNNKDRADSNSSLSSISTAASEKGYHGYSTTESTTTKMTSVTSQHLAETMATHFPIEGGAASHQSNMTTISKDSLQAIRDAVAVSLQRMKDLEEQVKAIPVLQVRISVLKEEKRLLGLQMEAKKHLNLVSRGVGDDTIFATPPPSPRSPPPAPAPKPKVRMAAVGDHSVLEPYLLQPELSSSFTTRDNSSHVFERQTIVIDRAQKQNALYMPESPRPITRSIGVGDGNILDDSLHIHEKELRTVIIGQGSHVGKRNVGIECRVPTRDIGISYNFDSVEKPATRTVGISTDTTALVTNVTFRSEEFTSALKNALSKSVRSVAIQVDSQKQYTNVGVQHASSAWNIRTIGVGDCSVDVEVRDRVARRSIGIEAFPDRMNHAVNTDYGWRLDASSNTVEQFTETSSTQTDQERKYAVSTMTEKIPKYQMSSQTDIQVFRATDQVKNSGTNTEKQLMYSTGMNTILRPVVDRGINTSNEKHTRNISVNTTGPDLRNIGVSEDRVDSFVCDLDDKNSEEEYRMEEEAVETKTVYYTTTSDKEDTKTDKGYEIERKYTTDSYAVQQTSQKEETESLEDSSEQNEEILEEKTWRTSGDGQFTVTITTSRKVFGGDEDGTYVTDTKTISGGPEILGTDKDRILKEVARGRRSSGASFDENTMTFKESFSGTSSSSSVASKSAIERVLGTDVVQQIKETTTLTDQGDMSDQRGMSSDSGMSSSQMSSSSEHSTYSTGRREGSGSPQMSYREFSYSSGDMNPQTMSSRSDSGIVSGSSSFIQTSSSGFVDSDGSLKSIMKKSTSDPGAQKRGITFAESVVGGESDGESSEEPTDDEEVEEGDEVEVEASSRGTTSDSDSSYDEGSYDSQAGSIVYKCKDDEAIANGLPGAKMFDQNIRETTRPRRFELGKDMKEACRVLSTYLEDSTTIQTKQLNSSLEVIQKEWLKVSASKLADAHQVEDYLSCFNEISKRLLEYIVNIQDSNGNTAMHYAVSNCNFEIVNLLLDTGVSDLNKLNKAGYTAIIMATLASVQTHRHEEVVQRLFSMGNVNIKAAKDGQTALMFAVRQGRTEMVKMLLDTGANTNIQDDEGSTALMCAAEHGHTEICKLLLNTPGCDANISDNDGSTALSIAMEAGHKDAGVLLYAHVNFGAGTSPTFRSTRF